MILKMILAVLLLFPTVVNASEMKNTCWPGGVNNDFNIGFNRGAFSSSKAGATADFYFMLPIDYIVNCWIDIQPGSSPKVIDFFNQSKMDLPLSEFGDGFYKLNEDIDVKISIVWFINHAVPSETGIWDGNNDIVPNGIHSFYVRFGSRTDKNIITLRLRRDQLGGMLIIPANVKLFRAFRSVWSQTVFNDTPFVSVSTAGQFIPVPIVCTINNGAAIEVDFGDIDNTQISNDGSRYVKTVPLQYRCNTAVTQDIDINLIATPAVFSSDFIATTLPDDIGVAVRYNGQIVKPNQKFATTLLNGVGQDELQVAPVIRDVTKAITGSFTASATLIMTLH
ncbi:fimbrial protein [Serratia silvae]|uniref:Fimbrial protein n=1 Tax=Serratia silvae TaxID=2824122 RepID=A0ABT0KCS3_9GAMM|nr:fimbrial protein [Serratia silvae]MCL1029816.1 fimbrial protein [Serratia silvae]